ncbi:hypothetical protein D1164_19115 [Mariniphaga sediminis]|jgi:membrane protein DedA with SNARE-associated domain|uniref:DUF6249 domain-containing protein n=1 Tax=Mariniphaga sediminis TaxID=1628158 RepID=A0A399CYS0_9BACT|nr:DUF6249 domain-containing protein [Mariniphaga sediminis]RIH63541.1 hypothetical protein D1164_19115 [Mariniphaga sediminis]
MEEGIFVPIGFFLAIFAVLYVYWTTRTKERLALIEKGADAGIFKTEPSKYALMKWGIFLIGAAVGVITGYALSSLIDEVVAFFTMIFFFGGVGLVVAHLIINHLSKKE